MLSGLLAFVQTTLISADGWGGGEMEYARKNKRDKKEKEKGIQLCCQKCQTTATKIILSQVEKAALQSQM